MKDHHTRSILWEICKNMVKLILFPFTFSAWFWRTLCKETWKLNGWFSLRKKNLVEKREKMNFERFFITSMLCDLCVYFGRVAYFYSFFIKINECSIEITLCRLVFNARRPVHNHALVNTADLARSTSFLTGRCYAGTLPPLGSRLSISLWLTGT